MERAIACPICSTQGAVTSAVGSGNVIRCPICREYGITGTAEAMLATWSQQKKWQLAGVVRRAFTGSRQMMRVTSDLLDSFNGTHSPLASVFDKQDALLFDIAFQSGFPGQVVKLSYADHIVVDAQPGDELVYHVQSLIGRKLLEQRATVFDCVLTPEGWDHIYRLRNPPGGNRADIFVAMAFDPSLADAWTEGLMPGIRDAGYRPKRVDSDEHIDKIDDRIMAGIRSCFAIVVDVTTQNRGAYFEAGFALGLGRPVVWTVRDDDIKNVHFDTRQFNHVVWSDPPDLHEKLKNRLVGVFGNGPEA